MNASGIAAERDVRGQLVQFVANGQRRTDIRFRGGPISVRDNRVRNRELLIEERLEDRNARAGNARMSGRI